MTYTTINRSRRACDTECYSNFFLASFCTTVGMRLYWDFAMWPGQPLDIAGLRALLSQSTIITFNGKNYDDVMLSAALKGYGCDQLKYLSDRIILGNMRPWDIRRELGVDIDPCIDDIDLIEILPGQHGLKMYMAKMHSRRIQELPIEPDALISPEQRIALTQYCHNDLEGNVDALHKFANEIKLREVMSEEYGVDLRSKSDAQIAEAVINHEIGFRVERPTWALGTHFHYDPPAFIQYHTPLLQQLLAMVRVAKFRLGDTGIDMPVELDSAKIKIGNSVYRLGIGGLHSSESSVFHVADDRTELVDVDVVSYYPRLMLNSGAYPPQMGPAFLQVYERIVDRRIAAKAAGDKKTADSLKITINGTFGKTLSKYGTLVAPKMGIQTTVTGQLSLLMLIESLEMCGIPVVSANTDGIVIKTPRALAWLRDQIVKDWEARTGLETEANAYDAIYSRDVNNYIAVKSPTKKEPERAVKLKGAYAPPVPVGGSWPNPGGEICVDAVIAYLLHRTPLDATIRACTDVRKFVYVRNVKGGGVKYHGDEVDAAKTKGGMRAQLAQAGWVEVSKEIFDFALNWPGGPLTMKDAHKIAVQQLRDANPVRKDYLGKVVRWYYAAGEQGAIRYKTNGNLVPKTEGARPMMELPDTLPADIDYEWYVREAKSLITDLGVAML